VEPAPSRTVDKGEKSVVAIADLKGKQVLVTGAAAGIGRSRVGSTGVPLNLFDIVTVVARRR